MINLNNDVLNRDRRKLFPKINTMSNKFSLNTMNLIKKQNPYKFYRSFYFKHILKAENNLERLRKSKTVTFLSLLSKSQNYFYSLPIQYDSSCENNITKSNCNLELNKFVIDTKIKKEKEKPNYFVYNNEINYIDFLRNKTLRNLHKHLSVKKKLNLMNIKKENNKKYIKNKRSKSCFHINMECLDNKYLNGKLNNRIEKPIIHNNISNLKSSKIQQTIKSENGCHNKVIIESYKYNKPKYQIQNEEKKFILQFDKNRNKPLISRSRNKTNMNNILTASRDIYSVNVFWNNLRRPIVIKSSNSVLIN